MHQVVEILLFDSPQGRPLHVWSFSGRAEIRIGRATENDVVLADPCVSRAHARLTLEQAAWHAHALSTQGVFHAGRKFVDLELTPGTLFRLGPAGPYLRFQVALHDAATPGHDSTILEQPDQLPDLNVDHARVHRELDAVTGDPFFQRLRDSVARLRGRPDAATREADVTPVDPPPARGHR
jgi:pSer/pThr/pTyr-binding forkhead associated (FHA) protein